MQRERGTIYLGGLEAEALASTYGTPLYVIEEDVLRDQVRAVLAGITYRPLKVFYAAKANWNAQIMRVLREEGTLLDVCSPGDVHVGLAAGYRPDEMLYTGYAVSDAELGFILEHHLALNVDSLSQLRRYADVGGKGKIGLRINTGVRAGFHPHVTSAVPTSKFGIHPAQLHDVQQLASARGFHIAGLQSHLGSDILEPSPFLAALDVLLEVAARLPDVEYVDLGGGMGAPFSPDDTPLDLDAYARLLESRLGAWAARHGRRLVLYIEPGEYLVAQAAHLLTRVIDVKSSVPIDGEPTPIFVGTDTSLNHIFAAAIYDGYHGILVANRADAVAEERVHVCGNLMQSGDVLCKARLLPRIYEGDLLLIQDAGAYAMSRGSQFNARPLPAEVMVRNGQAQVVRHRQTLDDLLRDQLSIALSPVNP